MMGSLRLLGMAWTVWKVASRRFGTVGALLVTAAVVGGFLYVRPWMAENVPVLSRILGEP